MYIVAKQTEDFVDITPFELEDDARDAFADAVDEAEETDGEVYICFAKVKPGHTFSVHTSEIFQFQSLHGAEIMEEHRTEV